MDAPEQQTDYITGDPDRGGASRLLAMWVCWVVLVLMLAAAGVVATA